MRRFFVSMEDNGNNSEEVDEVAELLRPETDEVVIQGHIAELERQYDEQQTTSAALEAIDGLNAQLDRAKDSGELSPALVEAISTAIDNQSAILGDEVITPDIALEGYTFGTITQRFVLQWKHKKDILTDIFRSYESMLDKYRDKTNSARTEYKHTSFEQEKVSVALHSLWYHYVNSERQVNNIIPGITEDVELSKYILVMYTNDVLSEFTKFSNIIKNADLGTEQSLIKFAKSVEGLKHPAELYNTKFVTKKQLYLSATGVVQTQGTRRKVIEIGSTSFDKLSSLATPSSFKEIGSAGRKFEKAVDFVMDISAFALAYNIARGLINKTATFPVSDIKTILDLNDDYLNSVENYLKQKDKFTQLCDNVASSLDKLSVSASGSKSKEARRLVKQIEQIANNYMECFQTPAASEVARSLKAAKYGAYLARRAIFNGS